MGNFMGRKKSNDYKNSRREKELNHFDVSQPNDAETENTLISSTVDSSSCPISLDVFSSTIRTLLEKHDNRALKMFLKTHVESRRMYIEDLKDGYGYNPIGYAVDFGNIQGMCILLEHGFIVNRRIFEFNPLAIALGKKDFSTSSLLLGLGCTYWCDDCGECGWPETCTLYSSITQWDLDQMELLIRSYSDSDLLSTFSRYVNSYPSDNFVEERGHYLLQIMLSKGIDLSTIIRHFGSGNSSFVKFLMKKGYVVPQKILSRCFKKLCSRYLYGEVEDDTLVSLIKTAIDAGADTSKEFKFCGIMCEFFENLPKSSVYEKAWPMFGGPDRTRLCAKVSLETALESSLRTYLIRPRRVNKNSKNSLRHQEKEKAYVSIDKYIKHKKRQVFIRKRVRGFEEGEVPDVFLSNFIGMKPYTFANVMKYLTG